MFPLLLVTHLLEKTLYVVCVFLSDFDSLWKKMVYE